MSASPAAASKRSLSLLFVSLRYPPYVAGGYEQLTQELARGLAARGHRVRVLCGAGQGFEDPFVRPWLEPRLEPERDLFAEVYAGGTRLAWRRHVRSRHNLAATRRALAEERPDVLVAANLGLASLAPLEAAAELGLPLLGLICDAWPANHWRREWRARGTKRWRLALLSALIDRRLRALGPWPMLVPSDFLRSELLAEGVEPARLERFTLGASPGLPKRPPPPRPRAPGEPLEVLVPSASWEGKGAHQALAAAARVSAAGVPLRVTVAGDRPGPYRQRLLQSAAAPELSGRVEFLGQVPQAALFERAARCHVCLFPTRWGEPFARAPIEALWLGLALLASDRGGTPELIVDGAEGRILPADDEPAWAEALRALAVDEAERLRLAAAGQRRALAEHRPESMLQAFERRLRLAGG